MAAIVELEALLRSMEPVLNPGTYVFASVPAGRSIDPSRVLASIREPEGLSVVLELEVARQEGITPLFVCAWITLTVHSDLQAVGLTAAFAGALGRAGISCNVVAGAFHDHIFVPEAQADEAMVRFVLSSRVRSQWVDECRGACRCKHRIRKFERLSQPLDFLTSIAEP